MMRFTETRVKNEEVEVFDSNNGAWIQVRELCKEDQVLCKEMTHLPPEPTKLEAEKGNYTRRRDTVKKNAQEEQESLAKAQPAPERDTGDDQFARRKDVVKERQNTDEVNDLSHCEKCGGDFKRLDVHQRFCK